MRNKIKDIINEPIEDLANLKADQIMDLFREEMTKTIKNLFDHSYAEWYIKNNYETKQN